MLGVTFADKHTFNDWNLRFTDIYLPLPEMQECYVEIPGRDGELDLSTALTNGDPRYRNRQLEFTFELLDGDYRRWHHMQSMIASYLHGQEMEIIIDTDKAFYWVGRPAIDSEKSDREESTIVITCNAQPYKYDRFSSLEDWKWDPFSFLDGIIQKLENIRIEGETEVVVIGRRKQVVPTLSFDSEMTLEFENRVYKVSAGQMQILDIVIKEGENRFKITGIGYVSIDYRGGLL